MVRRILKTMGGKYVVQRTKGNKIISKTFHSTKKQAMKKYKAMK